MSEKNTVYRVLARKYRPQKLSDLKGQELLAQSLRQSISDGRIPHAFLFHGIRGIGKTTTARIVAKALNCIGEDGKGVMTSEPCGVCKSCVSVQEDRHLDVLEIDAASHTSVDDIREIIDAARYKAVQGRYKIFIIDEVHMLSKSAFNALLKTLEEPPAHVKFIFATTELKKIPDTILSRCQRFDLKRIDQPMLIEYLGLIAQKEGFSATPQALSVLARAADGSMRDGLSLLDQSLSLTQAQKSITVEADLIRNMLGQADRGLLVDLLSSLLKGEVTDAMKVLNTLFERGADATSALQDIMDFIYAMVTYKTQKIQTNLGLSETETAQFLDLSQKTQLSVLLQSWQVLLKGYEELLKSPLQKQSLEMILLRLCYIVPLTIIDDHISAEPKTQAEKKNPKSKLTAVQDDPNNIDIKDFDSLLQALELKKEMMLHSHMRHDIHLVKFEIGMIQLRVTQGAKTDFIQALKIFLHNYTAHEWLIKLTAESGQKTLIEQQNDKQEKLNQEAISQTVVQSILKEFPDSKISTHNRELS
ncbi:MAG: DNA polymerase III subunit gamma/tau [Alphaproteobacteria bacterium CG_4_10_14_0_8_um_filter_37_21]|nr:MAG: DNA polymerase III subunit gamma/tau [Alphaproteobacteria bacterium CG_4_10_14_0_8_um_filter_37_21]